MKILETALIALSLVPPVFLSVCAYLCTRMGVRDRGVCDSVRGCAWKEMGYQEEPKQVNFSFHFFSS